MKWDGRGFWVVALGTFVISLISSYTSSSLLGLLPLVPAFGLLLVIVLVGIVFDIIGVAATAADEVPFHAMAADKVPGAKEAMWIVRNAASVATLCNDMIGDIAGTLSGAVGTGIAFAAVSNASKVRGRGMEATLLVAAIAAVTVGGKALGKHIAIAKAGDIVHATGKLIGSWETVTGIKITGLGRTVGRRIRAKKT